MDPRLADLRMAGEPDRRGMAEKRATRVLRSGAEVGRCGRDAQEGPGPT